MNCRSCYRLLTQMSSHVEAPISLCAFEEKVYKFLLQMLSCVKRNHFTPCNSEEGIDYSEKTICVRWAPVEPGRFLSHCSF
jgi:hypothetical protein